MTAHTFGLSDIFPGLDEVEPSIVYLMGCSSFNQFCCTLRALDYPEDFCPFCDKERARRNRGFEARLNGWGLLKNEFPRKDTSHMWLIIPERHVVSPQELTRRDWIGIGQMFDHCRKMLKMPGGGLIMRFGDPHYHAGTIEHLHLNMVEPLQNGNFRTPLAKTPEKHAEDYADLLKNIAELKRRGGEKWLLSVQGIEETQPKIA